MAKDTLIIIDKRTGRTNLGKRSAKCVSNHRNLGRGFALARQSISPTPRRGLAPKSDPFGIAMVDH